MMSQITNEGLVLACSAIGAGLALIAGIGPVSDRESPPVTARRPWEETLAPKEISCPPCFWDRQLPRRQVFTVLLSASSCCTQTR